MKSAILKTLLFTTFFCLTSVSQADVFRWVDDQGKVHIGVKPSAEPKKIEKAPASVTKPETRKIFLNTPDASPITTAPATNPTPAPVAVVPKAPVPVKVPVQKKPKVIKKAVATQPKVIKKVEKKSVVKKAAVKKAVVKKPAAKKAVVRKPAAKKAVGKKTIVKKKSKPKKVAESKKTTQAKNEPAKTTAKRNEEMCGVFSGYVLDYKEKVSSCSANLCDIYKRSLARYQKKQKSYCG